MARRPKPWFRRSRKSWFVTLEGIQHNLGPDKKVAYERFHELMRQPAKRQVASTSFASIADAFLDWTFRNRAQATFGWYQERLQSFAEQHLKLDVEDLKPFHVEKWATDSGRSINTHRNKMRAVKRCLRWAMAQGYIEQNPLAAMVIPSADPKDVYVSPEEFAELVAHVRSQEFRDLITVTYEVGCRPQESLRLEDRHVDLANSRWASPPRCQVSSLDERDCKQGNLCRLSSWTMRAYDLASSIRCHHSCSSRLEMKIESSPSRFDLQGQLRFFIVFGRQELH